MRGVLLRKLLSIERTVWAAKRGAGTTPISLDLPLASEEDDGLTLGGLLEYRGRAPDEGAETDELRGRIERASDLLTPRQRRLIQGLYADRSLSDLSRAFGVPRPTLYDEVRRIRQIFRSEGLADFLS